MINNDWIDVDWYIEDKKLITLADIDEGGSYEIDRAMIGLHKQTGKFVLMIASGCSCWGGEASLKYFNDLDELEIEMNRVIDGSDVAKDHDRVSEFYLSLFGCRQLINEAKTKFSDYCLKAFDEKEGTH